MPPKTCDARVSVCLVRDGGRWHLWCTNEECGKVKKQNKETQQTRTGSNNCMVASDSELESL